jgi:hypothetical protein
MAISQSTHSVSCGKRKAANGNSRRAFRVLAVLLVMVELEPDRQAQRVRLARQVRSALQGSQAKQVQLDRLASKVLLAQLVQMVLMVRQALKAQLVRVLQARSRLKGICGHIQPPTLAYQSGPMAMF